MPGLLQAWGMCWLCQRTRWSPQTAPKATVNPASKWQAVAATGALAYLNWRNSPLHSLTPLLVLSLFTPSFSHPTRNCAAFAGVKVVTGVFLTSYDAALCQRVCNNDSPGGTRDRLLAATSCRHLIMVDWKTQMPSARKQRCW